MKLQDTPATQPHYVCLSADPVQPSRMIRHCCKATGFDVQTWTQEDLGREKEAKAAETVRYEREMEAATRLAAAEKERKAASRVKEIERAEKVDRSRKETERLLAKQQADIDAKKVSLCIISRAVFRVFGGISVCPTKCC